MSRTKDLQVVIKNDTEGKYYRKDKFATRREYKGGCRFHRVFGSEEKGISERGGGERRPFI